MSQVQEINLIPYDVIVRERTQTRIGLWGGILALVIIVLVCGVILQKRRIANAEEAVVSLSMRKAAMEDSINELDALRKQREQISGKERIIGSLSRRGSLSLFFAELEKGMNDNVWLTSVDFRNDLSLLRKTSDKEDGDRRHRVGGKDDPSRRQQGAEEPLPGASAQLQGMALSNHDLSQLLKHLSRVPAFSEVNLKYSREAQYGKRDVVEFAIETRLGTGWGR